MVMTMIGASMLWVGWFGFNVGSNLEANGGATLAMDPPATTTTQPLRTVSQSEAGFEKIMQACVVTLAWPLGVGRHRLTVEFGGTAVDAAPDA
jgi:hypothetical protein